MTVSGAQERSHLFSIIGSLLPLAAFAGSMVGSLLPGLTSHLLDITDADPAAYRYPLMFAGALFLLTLPLVMATRPSSDESDQPRINPLRGLGEAPLGAIANLSLIMFLSSIGVGITMSFFNIYLDDGLAVTAALIGTMIAFTQIVAVPAVVLLPFIISRFGHVGGVQLGRLLMTVALVPLALFPSLAVAAVAMLAISATSAVSQQIFTIYSQLITDARWRTLMSGVLNTIMGCGWAVTAWGGGVMIEKWGYSALFLAGAGSTANTVAVFAIVARRLPVAQQS